MMEDEERIDSGKESILDCLFPPAPALPRRVWLRELTTIIHEMPKSLIVAVLRVSVAMSLFLFPD